MGWPLNGRPAQALSSLGFLPLAATVLGENADELFPDLLGGVAAVSLDGEAEQGQARGGEGLFHEAVALSAVGPLVGTVVEFDGGEGLEALPVHEDKIYVLGGDAVEGVEELRPGQAGLGLEEVGQSTLPKTASPGRRHGPGRAERRLRRG